MTLRPGTGAVKVKGVWCYRNAICLADAVQHLRNQGKPMPDALLAHTSAPTWEHIGFSGDFLRSRAAATAGRRRPITLGRGRVAA